MSDPKEIPTFLAKVPLFRGLKKRQLEKIANQFVPREYDAGKAIVTQGEGGEGFFIIVKGGAEVIREHHETKTVVNTLGATDFFGELTLLDDGLRTASVIATEVTDCLILTRWNFLAVLKEDADMAIVILEELARRFRMALDVL
jgi:CRP-like cAMP-binding protein